MACRPGTRVVERRHEGYVAKDEASAYEGGPTKKVHASFTKFQALVGPWDHLAEGAYHQLVAG